MAGLLKKLLSIEDDDRRIGKFTLHGQPTLHKLIRLESEIGGSLFGSVPIGHHRQFFNLDSQTWIWHEEWKDKAGKHISVTTRYEIHDDGVLKVQDDTDYYYVEGYELMNLLEVIRMYYEEVSRKVYKRDPATGKLLVA